MDRKAGPNRGARARTVFGEVVAAEQVGDIGRATKTLGKGTATTMSCRTVIWRLRNSST